MRLGITYGLATKERLICRLLPSLYGRNDSTWPLLRILYYVCCRAIAFSSLRSPGIFRAIEGYGPFTIIADTDEMAFRPKPDIDDLYDCHFPKVVAKRTKPALQLLKESVLITLSPKPRKMKYIDQEAIDNLTVIARKLMRLSKEDALMI